MASSPTAGAAVVLLDAYGTMIDLDPPAPRLRALLAADGYDVAPAVVESALAAEVAHYRANLMRAGDAAGLREVRAECAQVLAAGLDGDHPPVSRLVEMLVEAFEFRLFPDVVPALDALAEAGLRLGVVSNWDCSLPGLLARLGVGERFEVVVTSAQIGIAKPEPAPFLHALGLMGAHPGSAVHCGDERAADGDGARAAGVRAVVLRRPPRDRAGSEIASLSELADRVAG